MVSLNNLGRSIRKRIRLTKQRVGQRSMRTFKINPATIQLGSPQVYAHGAAVDCSRLNFPAAQITNNSPKLRSSLCTLHQLASPAFRYWAQELSESFCMHRKLWEFCFIMQALYERGMLAKGRRGLGFAVGEEPLPSLMAKLGCSILASDLDVSDERAGVWAETAQLASTLEGLNQRKLCDEETFKQLVDFRPIDMNRIPEEVNDFDFTWSSCSFEHCGSIGLGKRFIREQMKCLKPGGIAVHTTEFNLSSLEQTIDEGTTVIFRRQDIEAMIRDLQADGHEVEPLQLDIGASQEDRYIDLFPYSGDLHLKLRLFDQYVSTSVGLIVRKGAAGSASSTDAKAA